MIETYYVIYRNKMGYFSYNLNFSLYWDSKLSEAYRFWSKEQAKYEKERLPVSARFDCVVKEVACTYELFEVEI